MPSASDHPGASIVALVTELETSVLAADELLVERDWTALDQLLADQRRVTHAIANAMALSEGTRPEPFDIELKRRLRAIESRRDDQLRRVQAYNAAIAKRLSVMARAKVMRRATRPPILDKPALFDSRS